MPSATPAKLMTTEELLSLPDDGVERWLVEGELRERPMTKRNLEHSSIMAQIAYFLVAWMRQTGTKGKVVCGEAGIRLCSSPDTTVGVDVAFLPASLIASRVGNSTLASGAPPLIVEILSPSDKQEDIDEKIDAYLRAGVPNVWIVDPHDRTILVHRPGTPPQLFNIEQEIAAEPQLPGFRASVADVFA